MKTDLDSISKIPCASVHTFDLIFPRNSLHSQKLLDTRTAVKAAETAHLGATVGEIRLVVDGHTVDVDGTVISRQQMLSKYTFSPAT